VFTRDSDEFFRGYAHPWVGEGWGFEKSGEPFS
jgi:hypothetical protein